MAGAGTKSRRMRRWGGVLMLAALASLTGCASLNDAVVRGWFTDRELSGRVHDQIRRGLEQREKVPVSPQPSRPSPAFLDQG